METPSQTYERVTGKKWTGGTSTDIQSAYQQYGITAPAGSSDANIALQKALNASTVTSPIIAKQSGIIQSTQSTNAKDTANGSKIDTTVTDTYGPKPVPTYGSDVKDAQGNVIGQAKYDPNTGKPLTDPNATNPTPTGAPAPTNPNPTGPTTPDGKSLTDTVPSGFSYNLPPLEDPTKKRMYSPDGHVYTVDAKGVATLDPTGEAEYAKNAEYNTKAAERNAMYDTYKKGLDQAHQALIDSIKVQADQQRIKMEELNKRTLGLKTVQGYRTGSAEYTPEIDTGILKKEEEEGMDRLSAIDANMKIALAQAVAAKSAKDFELLNARLDKIDQLQKAKEDAVQGIYKNYIDNAKMISDKLKETDTIARANRDQALQELTTKAPELVTQYDALKTPAEQKVWIDLVSKKTGLDPELILGEMQKIRLTRENTQSIIDKREQTPAEKAISNTEMRTQQKANKENDIAEAILRFKDQIKTKNWKGVNPDEYEFYKKYIKDRYGASAVLELDKAIDDASLSIDNGN